MFLSKLGCTILIPLCLYLAAFSAARAADIQTADAAETCDDPGKYDDWTDRLEKEKVVAASTPASDLLPGEAMPPVTYKLVEGGPRYGLSDFLKETRVAGFIVLHRGKVVKEIYCGKYTSDSQFNFQSIAKSIISTLIGIMLKERPEYSVETKAGVAPSLRGSIYEKVSLRSILQMSSGARFKDKPNMPFFFATLVANASLAAKVKSQRKLNDPDKEFRYSGIDTAALGMVLAAITGKSNPEYLEEKLWKPLGMEAPAIWRTNRTNEDMSFCCLYANLRDIARFGQFIAQDGTWNGKRLLPEGWVYRATHPDSKHLMPDATHWLGYQYQWWAETEEYIPDAFYGMGIHGQNLYVDPQEGLVVVITSKWPKDEVPAYYKHTRKFMRAISRCYRSQQCGQQ